VARTSFALRLTLVSLIDLAARLARGTLLELAPEVSGGKLRSRAAGIPLGGREALGAELNCVPVPLEISAAFAALAPLYGGPLYGDLVTPIVGAVLAALAELEAVGRDSRDTTVASLRWAEPEVGDMGVRDELRGGKAVFPPMITRCASLEVRMVGSRLALRPEEEGEPTGLRGIGLPLYLTVALARFRL
jgi:hypothetical protein